MVQNKIIDNEKIISTYAEVALGIHPEVKRSGGILLTVEDLLTIKFYVEFGFGLPNRLHEVEAYLGYRAIGIAGLEPRDIQELFRKIKINVSKWDGIEAGLLTQNRDLETFSSHIISVGNEIIKCIDNMPVLQRMKKIEENGVIPPGMLFHFNSTDNEVATELVSWLEDLKSEVDTRRRDTLNLKNKITDFNQEISDVLEPSIRRKRDLIRNNSLNAEIQELYEQIEQKAREIEQLQRDYEHFKGLAFSGLVGGPIGLAITQGIYSPKAEDARRRMNQLIVEKNILNQQLNEKDQLKIALESVSDKLARVSITLLDSESASDDLQVVWDNIYYQIETSANTLANIKEGTKLITFKTQFLKVINPWENAKDSITQLVNLISQVLESYDEGAGITQFGVPN